MAAAIALGEMGFAEDLSVLKEALACEVDDRVKLRLLLALAMLHDDSSMNEIAQIISNNPESEKSLFFKLNILLNEDLFLDTPLKSLLITETP